MPTKSHSTLVPEGSLFSQQSRVNIEDEVVQRSASVIQYLSQVGDVEAIQEKLTDLALEHDQLINEQASRARFGLKLDEESQSFLDTFHELEDALLDQLAYAEIVLDALRQLIHDSEALRITNDAYVAVKEEPSEMIDLPDIPAGSYPSPTDSMTREDHSHALPDLGTIDTTFTALYKSDIGTADSANFINTWMLHRMSTQPDSITMFSRILRKNHPTLPAEDLENLFLHLWFGDATAAVFRYNRSVADEYSMQANRTGTPTSHPESGQLPLPQLEPLEFLRTGPAMTAAKLIEQAMRARSNPPSIGPGD